MSYICSASSSLVQVQQASNRLSSYMFCWVHALAHNLLGDVQCPHLKRVVKAVTRWCMTAMDTVSDRRLHARE